MNGYIIVREAAERWGIIKRQAQKLCAEGRIDGVTKFSNTWIIPEDAPQPTRTVLVKPGREPKTSEVN